MGQYGNQPDFGTIAQVVTPTGNPIENNGVFFAPSALYIGTGGDIVVTVVGENIGGLYETMIFRNVPDGTFFPVIVTAVWITNDEEGTTCSNIIALR
jgi:hypothetical protein